MELPPNKAIEGMSVTDQALVYVTTRSRTTRPTPETAPDAGQPSEVEQTRDSVVKPLGEKVPRVRNHTSK